MRDGWRTTTIGEIAEVVGGGTPSTKVAGYWDGNIAWITPSEVTRHEGTRVATTERRITEAGLSRSGARLLPPGSILLTSRATIGAVAINAVPMATNQGFAALVPEASVVLSEFLMYWCQANKQEFITRAGGNTFLEVSRRSVAAVPISLPPMSEQRRIADLVASVENEGRRAREVDDAACALARALRAQAFDASGADAVPLGSLCGDGGIQIGPFGSQLHASDYIDDGIPTVMPKDIVDGRINVSTVARVAPEHVDRLARHRLEVGDILIPRRGDLTKRALVGEDEAGWLCGTGTARIRVQDVDPRVVLQAMSGDEVNDWLASNAVGITMPNLNTEILNRLPLRLPVNSEAVVTTLEAIDDLRSTVATLATRCADLRESLLRELLTGVHHISDRYDDLLTAVG